MTGELTADVAVIGLGGMGSAAAAHLAARGARVIGIEQFGPLHDRGSSHGDTRIVRLGYFEGASYVPLLRRAFENWRTLEARSGMALMTLTGVIQIGRPDSTIVSGVLASCAANGLAYQLLDGQEAMRRFPAFALDADEVAVVEEQGGFVMPEAAIMAHLRLAGTDGAILRFGERVAAIEPGDGGVRIVTDLGAYRVRAAIVAAGSYVARLVPELAPVALPIRQVVGWYEPRDAAATRVGAMPVFLHDRGADGSWFGFPALGPQGVKIGRHNHFMEEIDPDATDPPVNAADRALLDDYIARHLPAAAGRPLRYSTCRYTILPDEEFLIDRLPGQANVIVASPCSGHGYKFASVVGEILADLALAGGTDLPVEAFSFAALAGRKA